MRGKHRSYDLETQSSTWILDSGTASHMIENPKLLDDINCVVTSISVNLGKSEKLELARRGSFTFLKLSLLVSFVSGLNTNTLSCAKLWHTAIKRTRWQIISSLDCLELPQLLFYSLTNVLRILVQEYALICHFQFPTPRFAIKNSVFYQFQTSRRVCSYITEAVRSFLNVSSRQSHVIVLIRD